MAVTKWGKWFGIGQAKPKPDRSPVSTDEYAYGVCESWWPEPRWDWERRAHFKVLSEFYLRYLELAPLSPVIEVNPFTMYIIDGEEEEDPPFSEWEGWALCLDVKDDVGANVTRLQWRIQRWPTLGFKTRSEVYVSENWNQIKEKLLSILA